ncbi:MAG TPA: ribonuclease P protein component 1 [Candidatus Acidoferrales bacterium]|nr:ribonuclease P protein component 1 [Candidatus Acidoferrales bacterium]
MNPITPQTILRHELIGLKVRVTEATNPTVRGLRGSVVDETKNMLKILSPHGALMIPKGIATFRFTLSDGVQVDVDGRRLIARPEARLKTRVKRW